MSIYITALGKFLPGEAIDNASMERYLGQINGKASRARTRILKQNGIEARYYAIDTQQKTLFSNAEMAARAVACAVERGLSASPVRWRVGYGMDSKPDFGK